MVCPNDPTANDCKIVDYRGEKIAAFMIGHKTMLCLPQVFELFLKNLVGGLHTVYTKCKRLELSPMICNVEQVRVLRGLGAIQPGVNRCKLIADCDFDTLYKDCTTSRNQCYASTAYRLSKMNMQRCEDSSTSKSQNMACSDPRPPKRVMPFPAMSPQDAMLRLHQPGMGHPHQHSSPHTPNSEFPHMDRSPFPPPLPPGHPMAQAHLMAGLGGPAGILSRSGLPGLPGMPLGGLPMPGGTVPGSPQALLESYKQSYGDMIKHLQGLQKNSAEREEEGEKEEERIKEEGNVLNLSHQAQSDVPDDSLSRRSDSDIGEPEVGTDDDMDCVDESGGGRREEVSNPVKKEEEGAGANKPASMFQMMNHIQSLISMAVENAKQEEKSISHQKTDLKEELEKEKESQNAIRKRIEEESKTTDLYLRRFRKEKKWRRKLQEQLEVETKKIQALEAALRSLSYDTLVKVKESIAREAACREIERQGDGEAGEGRREREGEEGRREEERPTLPPSPHSPPHSRPSPSLPQYSLSSQAAAQLSYNIQQLEAGRALTSFPPSLPVPLPPTVPTSY